jgi:ABC-type transporter Mla MlaB component
MGQMPATDPAPGLIALRAVSCAEVVAACARLRALAQERTVETVACDVSALAAEVAAIEALARLALHARRSGCSLRLRRASPQVRELVELCGLSDALSVECQRQAEEREEPLGVQEGVESGDAPVGDL